MFKQYTAKEYLYIDIANNFSKELDRSNFENRIDFVNSHSLNELYKMKHDAINPCLFEAGLLAYKDMINENPSGYPISLDCCASGISILSLLTNCKSSANHTGLLGDNRQDAYTNIYKIYGDSELDQHITISDLSSVGSIKHEDLKKSIMTFFYSSEAQYRKLLKFNDEAISKFHNILSNELTGPYNARYFLESLWDETKLVNEWIMPDGFHVHIPIITKETHKIPFEDQTLNINIKVNKPNNNYRSLAANITHSVDAYLARELNRRCNFNKNHIDYLLKCIGLNNKSTDKYKDQIVIKLLNQYEITNILSVRILDYLDKENIGLIEPELVRNLILSLPENRFDMLSTHDCFRVLPSYGNDLRQQFNNVCHSIAGSNLLSSIAYQLSGEYIEFEKDKDYIENIKHSQYGLS